MLQKGRPAPLAARHSSSRSALSLVVLLGDQRQVRRGDGDGARRRVGPKGSNCSSRCRCRWHPRGRYPYTGPRAGNVVFSPHYTQFAAAEEARLIFVFFSAARCRERLQQRPCRAPTLRSATNLSFRSRELCVVPLYARVVPAVISALSS